MKKLLTILILLLAVASQGYATLRTVWAGKQAISWAETPPAGATQLDTYGTDESHPYRDIFKGLKKDDIIKITVTDNESSPQYRLQYKNGDNWEIWTDLTVSGPTEYVLSYTVESEEIATLISARGLVISGENYAITKIDIEGYDTSSTTWEGYVAISWNTSVFAGIQFDTYNQMSLEGLSASDKIKITYVVEEGQTMQYELVYKTGPDWNWTTLSSNITDENNILTYTVPDDDMANLLAGRGLIIKGQFFYITKVEVEKASSATQYTLIVTQPNGGKIQIGGNDAVTQAYDEGTELSLAAVPISNYQFSEWSSTTEGVVTDGNKSTSPLAITMNQAINITASFSVINAKILDYVHELVTNDEFGSMSSATTGNTVRVLISKGTGDKALEIYTKTSGWDYVLLSNTVPEGNYVDITVTDDNKDNISTRGLYIKGSNITVSNVGILYSFSVTEHANGTVAITVNDETTPTEETSFISGTKMTANATATTTDYEFASWTKSEDAEWSSTDNPLVINSLDGNYTLTATFTNPKILDYTHDYFIAASNFSDIAVGGSITFTCTVPENQTGQLKIIYPDSDGNKVYTNDPVTLANDGTYMYSITDETICNSIKTYGLWIQGAYATFVSVTFTASVTPVFDENGKADLSKFVSDGVADYSYAEGKGTISTGGGETYKGVILNLGSDDYVRGTKMIFKFQSETSAQIHVNYVGAGWSDGAQVSTTGTEIIVPLDYTKQVDRIDVQLWNENTTAVLTEVSVSDKCTLTVSAPATYGSVAVKQGQTPTTATEFDYGTSLTLTATANEGYEFLKWQKNGVDAGTDATLSVTMSADTEITALFQGAPLGYEDKRTLFEGSVDINWRGVAIQPSTVGAILEAGEQLILTTTVAEGAYGQVEIRSADQAIAGSYIGGLVNGENVITLTSAMVEAMRDEFGFWGENATLTKVVLYKPVTVFSEAGVADLTTMTESEGKSTLAVPHNEALTGNVLVVESNENAAVKVTFSDNTTATNKPGDRKIGNPTGSQALVLLDRSKFIKTIEIDKAKAAITKIYMSSLTLFEKSGEDYIADLSLAKAMDNTTFDTSSYTIATTVAWSGGIQLDVLEGETVKGKELMIQTESDADLKVTVEYESGDKTEVQDRPASKEMKVVIDGNRAVKQILIQPKTASVTKLLKVAVNASATPDPNVFSKDDKGNFVADLSMVKAEGATYNNTTFTMVATDSWQGVTVTPGNAEVVKGKELYIEFDKAALGYAKISYVDDETSVEGGLDAAGTVMKIALDDSKQISKIEIKLKEAGTAKFKKIAVNATETADESGDDDEEAIIDEKTGEADLTVLAPQDDTKTTLTENEDGSITMTTTEPYCAAQIWFSDPEVVAGNVLKVELAESNVNVTVTVKYTDGTESQMSANTMVANARAMTRAVASARAATRGDSDSGTTVEVPLETGKEVQNIEVKNNVAGTITIKKMQVTTINVFTNGEANLSMLKPQSNATYDTAAHTLATTKGWTGATISPVAGENVSGKELLIEFADASKVKVAVKYRTDVEGPSTIMEKAAKTVRLALDNTKNIQEISIQPTEASIVTFTKIAVNSEESDDGTLKPGKTITLWESAAGETLSWNEVANQDASVGEILQEYDELLITISGVTEGCDWPKVFIRDASSEQAGNEVLLNDIGSFPYTVRIVLTGEMAQQLQEGFSICGDGVTVTKLQVYRPEAPKEGDIHLADLNYGYNSSYDKGTHTITTTARWAARGWEIGDKRYNDKNLITVKFEPVDFPVTLKMEYTTGIQTAQATSVGVPAGRTELMLEIPSGISKLNRVYIIYENPGSVKLTEASVTYQDKLKLSTAIEAFEAEGVIHDGRYDTDGWYNLRGMRIAEPKTSGIYIHGGKKVVIY